MAETTADVRRDIEMTRERISTTLAQLEQKTNVVQIVRDHPWPALAAAVGVGVLLSGTRADVKAAGATVAATKGASSKLGSVLDDAVANLMGGVHQAFQGHVDSLVSDIKKAIGGSAAGAYAAGTRDTAGRASLADTVAGNGGGAAAGSFAGSGASGSPVTASPVGGASGAMGTPAAGASASSPSSGSSGAWAPQTAEGLGGASASNAGDLGPGGIEGTGGQDYRTNRAD